MKKLFLICTLLVQVHTLMAQGNFNWAFRIGGESDDIGRAITIDRKSDIYITGNVVDSADFDPGPDTTLLPGRLFIARYDSSSHLHWARSISGKGTIEARSICTDAAGSVYITGYFDDSMDFDPGAAYYPVKSTWPGGEDAFIVKLDSAGKFRWVITYAEMGSAIKADNEGNIVVTGYFNNFVDFDPGPGTTILNPSFGSVFVMKLDTAGKFIWARNYGDKGSLTIKSLAIDPDNNIISSGAFQSMADFDPGPDTAFLYSVAGTDQFISKLDDSGHYIWAKSFVDSNYANIAQVAVDAAGSIYTAGHFKGSVDFDPGPGTYPLSAPSSTDLFICKLDSNGLFTWAKQIGGRFDEYCYTMTTDRSGNVYFSGLYEDSVDFDPGPGVTKLPGHGADEIYITHLDSAGNFVWARSTNGCDYAYWVAIAADDGGNVYLTGSFGAKVDFNPGLDTFFLESGAFGQDAFLLRLSPLPPPVFIPGIAGSTPHIAIYPNPVTGIFHVGGKDLGPAHIRVCIYSTSGRLISCQEEQYAAAVAVDMSQQASDIYFVQVWRDGILAGSGKVFKQ